jgi:phosphoserine phosphatase RsbU/P
MALPFTIRRKISRFIPTSMMGRLALYLLVLRIAVAIIQGGLQLAGRPQTAAALNGWAYGLSIVLVIVLTVLALRWIRRVFMWRLRNRLMVTYVFIGVVPLVLVITMAAIALGLFANQYATSQARVEIDSEIRTLEALTQQAVDKLASSRVGAMWDDIVRMQRRYPGYWMDVWEDGVWRPIAASKSTHKKEFPQWVKGSFSGIVVEEGKLFLRSAATVERAGKKFAVVSSVPVTKELLDRSLSNVGEIRFYLAREVPIPDGQLGERGALIIRDDEGGRRRSVDYQLSQPDVVGGKLPPATGSWDLSRSYATISPYRDWKTGSESVAFVEVGTRVSVLLNRLFSSRGEFAGAALAVLIVIGIFFALIELVALFVGVSLTRTITLSVYKLYQGTQRINRGDLKYRIDVKSNDQLAALQHSFNSMSESLERLIEEQKEKERLENELAIAQEVQATLFPRANASLKTLELHGVCRPARTVSGDYYDFIPFKSDDSEQLGLAVGDISGKGISAALLMATVHSAVRAYEFGRLPIREEFVRTGAAAIAGAAHVSGNPRGELMVADGFHSPAEVLRLLNHHLYHSTQPEKYATLFLGGYDGASRTLTYSNAGHLPPFIVGADGGLRRLEIGGIVIGLFDNMVYEESRVDLHPGDIFVAYSDGITEPENEFGEFGEARLIELVREHRHLPLERISEHVIAAVQDWIGTAEQPDDVTLVLARAR